MKPFKTNKKDRETFARVMGWKTKRNFIYIDSNTIVLEKDCGNWQFANDGFQRTMARLHEFGYRTSSWQKQFAISHLTDPYHGGFIGESNNTGEALFRAVVAMGEAQK